MGSTRFPGKMLKDLCGRPVLEWALERTRRSSRLDGIVLATSRAERDDPLKELASDLGIPTYRGSEDDVLRRYVGAASAHQADVVIRVCADNPLVSPEEIDRIIDFYESCLRRGALATRLYVSNATSIGNNGYPDGLGAEVFSMACLRYLDEMASDPAHREHVNGFLLAHPQRFDIRTPSAPREIAFPDVRLDIDSEADLDQIRVLCRRLSVVSRAVEVVNAYRLHADPNCS